MSMRQKIGGGMYGKYYERSREMIRVGGETSQSQGATEPTGCHHRRYKRHLVGCDPRGHVVVEGIGQQNEDVSEAIGKGDIANVNAQGSLVSP